jgi:type III secretion protein H
MRIEGGEPSGQPPTQPLPPPEPIAQRQFDRLLTKAPEPDLFERWQQGAPLDGLLANAAPAARRELLWQVYQQGDKRQAEIGKQLFEPVANQLTERFGGRQLPVIAAIDQLELRALMREFDPLASRREAVLLDLLSKLKGEQRVVPPEHEFLDALARRELMTLIPQNGMVANLMRHSHKLDLED